MSYSYNKERFKELIESGMVTKTALRRICGGNNYSTITRWMEGEDIYIGKLLSICNEFNLDLTDFITTTNESVNQVPKNKEPNVPQLNIDSSVIIEYERKMAALQVETQKEISRERETKIKELASLELKLNKATMFEIEEERSKLKTEYKQEINQIQTDFKNLLKEKDQEISELKKQLTDSHLAYKKLELENFANEAMKPLAIADKPKTYRTKRNETL